MTKQLSEEEQLSQGNSMQQRGEAYASPLFQLRNAMVVREGKCILSVPSFSLDKGAHVALLGPNGSGKSTFIKLLTREIMPLHKDVPPWLFQGSDRVPVSEIKKVIGVVSSSMQNQICVHLPVREVVMGGLFGSLGIPRGSKITSDFINKASSAMETLGVVQLAHRDVSTLSTGQARRVLIARALVHNPETLVLDEPCAGLDPEGMYYIRRSMRALAQAGKGIILVTHSPEDIIPEIPRVVLMKEGSVYADGSKEDLLTSLTMSELFSVPLEVECRVQKSHSLSDPLNLKEQYFSLVSVF